MKIRRAKRADMGALTQMATFLWPFEPVTSVAKAMRKAVSSAEHAVFIAEEADGTPVGFTDISLRRDYVPGVMAFPVAYIEGIFVRRSHRRKGVAAGLVSKGEAWALEKGSGQIASDTWVWNTLSQEFHTRIGFAETERTVHYVKRIEREDQ